MKTATISDFKAHISENLRLVRAGEHILILDRDHPVAEVGPVGSTVGPAAVRPARNPFAIPPAPSLNLPSDAIEILAVERGDH